MSLKKLEAYKYLASGTFEKEVKCDSKNYEFKGEFKDIVITDFEDPAIKAMLRKQTPDALKQVENEIKKN
jgi:hypothetical protein